ncbi:glutathione peroxidase [Bacillus pakistanensis]|uniref:Glutathione peroxidase n=1 Tax=Rossellomorea pakistanensis TaxID=992288 RepID=A0ABS2NKK6_9BACI|nr:glutathione peroxidase [Bacillus pakistanensis]MBM7588390.1 glutathione peroxidase [Bacillus pakistanensis]
MNSLYEINVQTPNGEEVSLENYKGNVLLIVNTASKCGFTPQFEELQNLYKKYQDQGLVVLGFPCDQFMNQEFETNKEILEFCQINYGVKFPMFSKVDVKGSNQHPLFKFLVSEKKGMLTSEIKWNFTKFLIDSNGNVFNRYAPQTNPAKIEKDIIELLNK